jgi:hypothetical protein
MMMMMMMMMMSALQSASVCLAVEQELLSCWEG